MGWDLTVRKDGWTGIWKDRHFLENIILDIFNVILQSQKFQNNCKTLQFTIFQLGIAKRKILATNYKNIC